VKLIVGLGNPGRDYSDTRHNIGFLAVRDLSRANKIALKKDRNAPALCGKGKIGQQPVMLALPLTFMNLSGVAVGGLLKRYKVDAENLLVICDDVDIEFGRFKLKCSGSSAGHRGVESIIAQIGSNEFCRLRIGIGRPKLKDTAEYVLSPFKKQEKKQLNEVIKNAGLCAETWAAKGAAAAMNFFNRKQKEGEKE
jgi:peptidyl-tRNA hydrolase, PTH1 family